MSKCECRDCIHYEVCEYKGDMLCDYFKAKSLFVELPCKTGGEVWFIAKKENDKQFSVIEGQVGCFRIESYYSRLAVIHWTDYQETYRYIARFEDFGKTVFFDRESAERKLREVGE